MGSKNIVPKDNVETRLCKAIELRNNLLQTMLYRVSYYCELSMEKHPPKSAQKPTAEQSDIGQNLIRAYNNMLLRVKDSMHELRVKQAPKLQEHLTQAKQKAVELGELTEHEAEKIADYLKRDIEGAAQFMSTANKRFQDWLVLDWQTVEAKLFDMCRQVADQSVLEWRRLRQRLPLRTLQYRSGEITGIGSLKCSNCSQIMNFSKTSRIPPCPKCHKTEFQRMETNDSN